MCGLHSNLQRRPSEVEQGIWPATLVEYGPSYIEPEEKPRKQLDNCFGPKFLPLLPVHSGTYVSCSRAKESWRD